MLGMRSSVATRAPDDTANVFRIVADAEPVNPAVDYARAS
jgi:hypothetical protein|tara:strand:+ start:276 stop:395 length:120 start_codon:yes stop_codon:yes gene_type:complete